MTSNNGELTMHVLDEELDQPVLDEDALDNPYADCDDEYHSDSEILLYYDDSDEDTILPANPDEQPDVTMADNSNGTTDANANANPGADIDTWNAAVASQPTMRDSR